MKMQVFNSQHRAGARKGRRYRLGVVGKDLPFLFGHRVKDRPGFVRQMAPHVITDLLSGVFHVPHQDSPPRLVQVLPPNSGDFLLSAGREDREGNHLRHID